MITDLFLLDYAEFGDPPSQVKREEPESVPASMDSSVSEGMCVQYERSSSVASTAAGPSFSQQMANITTAHFGNICVGLTVFRAELQL